MSIRNDICDNTFKFPEKMVLEKKLKDILDDEVDEKYYIEDVSSLTLGATFDVINGGRIGKMLDVSRRAYHTDGISPAVHTCGGGNQEPKIIASRGRYVMGSSETEQHLEVNNTGTTNTITSVAKDNYVAEPVGGGIAVKTANKKGYDMAKDGDGIDLAYPNSTTRRGRVGHGVSKTLECSDTMGTLQNYRIRKLTPKECWRLMGFDDSDFEKAEKVNSNSQLYKQAGNSIVVNVLEGILRNLLCKTTK